MLIENLFRFHQKFIKKTREWFRGERLRWRRKIELLPAAFSYMFLFFSSVTFNVSISVIRNTPIKVRGGTQTSIQFIKTKMKFPRKWLQTNRTHIIVNLMMRLFSCVVAKNEVFLSLPLMIFVSKPKVYFQWKVFRNDIIWTLKGVR